MLELSPLLRDINWNDAMDSVRDMPYGWRLPTLQEVVVIMQSKHWAEYSPRHVWTSTNFRDWAFFVSPMGRMTKGVKDMNPTGINARLVRGNFKDILEWVSR